MAESLVVVSKVKQVVKQAGFRTGGDYIDGLSKKVGELVQASIAKVQADGRRRPWEKAYKSGAPRELHGHLPGLHGTSLYDARRGFYSKRAVKEDFTPPELHPAFAEILTRKLADLFSRMKGAGVPAYSIVEMGSGSGLWPARFSTPSAEITPNGPRKSATSWWRGPGTFCWRA